jgi:two-component system response regulator VicR
MKHKILLVEDDVNLAFVVKDTLVSRDYDVYHSADGNGALKAIAAHKYDIVLLDVMLPGMDGFTVSKQIRQQRNQTPILFLTAKGLQEDRIKGFESGGDDYLTKPFSIEELTLRIKASKKLCPLLSPLATTALTIIPSRFATKMNRLWSPRKKHIY